MFNLPGLSHPSLGRKPETLLQALILQPNLFSIQTKRMSLWKKITWQNTIISLESNSCHSAFEEIKISTWK
ncbi:hypothetical protein TorRG33x02_097810 [Trema orientale]|uniref:Uncharacterized protein n=1 Tax=Trema orientale TaxID=63057 RepID=A0A2P5F938_TREOI|nr:hypothetical protein TorRG33x02_097810 [Trema orientale]